MDEIISEWLDSQSDADSPRDYLHGQQRFPSLRRPYDDALDALRRGDKQAARLVVARCMDARLRWEALGDLVADAYNAAETQAVRRIQAQSKVGI